MKNFASVLSEVEDDEHLDDEKSTANTDVSTEVRKSKFKKFENRNSGNSEIEIQEIRKSNDKKFENRNSRDSEIETQEIRFSNPNYNNISYTDMNYTNPINPINHSELMDTDDGIDSHAFYMDIIRQNIEYDTMLQNPNWKDAERYEELYQLICEVVCIKRQTVRIAGEDYPYELVKSKFLKLNSSHLLYIIESMNNTTTKISNIKAYMITALYNAPNTMNSYYQQAVQHDMYGGGWQEKGII